MMTDCRIVKSKVEKLCTHCAHAKLYLPTEPGEGWITCPHRSGNRTRIEGAPCVDAFPEFSRICNHFKHRA